jgi:hypothetical protein
MLRLAQYFDLHLQVDMGINHLRANIEGRDIKLMVQLSTQSQPSMYILKNCLANATPTFPFASFSQNPHCTTPIKRMVSRYLNYTPLPLTLPSKTRSTEDAQVLQRVLRKSKSLQNSFP